MNASVSELRNTSSNLTPNEWDRLQKEFCDVLSKNPEAPSWAEDERYTDGLQILFFYYNQSRTDVCPDLSVCQDAMLVTNVIFFSQKYSW